MLSHHAVSDQDQQMADALATMGNPTRLAILRQLRTPKVLREIVVRVPDAGPARAGEGAFRTISRQAVRQQLDQLVELGVVIARETERDLGPSIEYQVNHLRIFAIAEQFRALGGLRPVSEPEWATVTHEPGSPGPGDHSSPCLVLVRGLDEGRMFALRPPVSGSRSWTIGRSRAAEVSLDFDPYLSTENTVVAYEDGAFHASDLPDSRNGTTVNFRPLRPGRRHVLRSGDVIGAGRCLLLFRDTPP